MFRVRFLLLSFFPLLLLQAHGGAKAQGISFPIAAAGCSMAHCDPRMSDGVRSVSPTVASLVAMDPTTTGGQGGLGCVSNSQLVACTNHGGPPPQSNLVVYDADGHMLWNDGGLLGNTAWMSAPIIGSDGSVIAADQTTLIRVSATTNTIVWKSQKPDAGNPISPVLVGSDNSMVLLATNTSNAGGTPELSVWDAATGALLSHQAIVGSDNGRIYVSRNTPAVRGAHAYVLMAAQGTPGDGRLYAVDVCESDACGGRGAISLRWHYDFAGPSGSSPLLIGTRVFFDGRPTPQTGAFMGVDDLGIAPSLAWARPFPTAFVTNAAQDPRGGLWVVPMQSPSALRLDPNTGATVQEVVVSPVMGLPSGYTPASVMSVSATTGGAVGLTFGTAALGQNSLPTYVAAIDVSSTPQGSALWLFQVAGNAATNTASGQYPIVTNADGARRVVFQGSNSATFFVGEAYAVGGQDRSAAGRLRGR